MISPRPIRAVLFAVFLAGFCALRPAVLRAEEHIVLANGFELNCSRHEVLPDTGKVRIYSSVQGGGNPSTGPTYFEVAASSVRLIEAIETPVANTVMNIPKSDPPNSIRSLLTDAGAQHHIDVDLLASLVNAESGGHATAVSRTGARGLMQLMPSTAASFGVRDSFRPDQNIAGGSAYLDQLLSRYHDDMILALAAYNAGPGAVDRWHGVPPYRETRAYVARIVNEYNHRKKAALAAEVR